MSISKVLVVDDSDVELSKIKKIITDAGFNVCTANNGKEAIDIAKAEQPDVIFMDILMPEMTGFEATRKLSNDSQTRSIPIIFVSSKDKETDKLWAEMQGGSGYVTKPYSREKIIEQIEALN